MAKRVTFQLPEGTSFLDYASPSRILQAYNNDMKAIRAEASRERSIIRKRIERMEQAGETYNTFYQRFHDRETALPNLKNLSDAQILEYLGSYAQSLAGGYQSTVREIRERRRDIIETIRTEAEENGDEILAQALSKDPTAKQMSMVGKLMGMTQKIVGKNVDSGTMLQMALKLVISGNKKESLLNKAGRIIAELGLDDEDEKLENLKNTFTSKGGYRVSYLKSRGKRG